MPAPGDDRRDGNAVKVQVQRYGDGWIVRWLDDDRPLPPGARDGKGARRDDCASCWRSRARAAKWSERELAAATLPPPLICTWCAVCEVATWYASVPTQSLRFKERAS
jgi:hypothetical protein